MQGTQRRFQRSLRCSIELTSSGTRFDWLSTIWGKPESLRLTSLFNQIKALTHYTRNFKKCSYLSYTLQLFFHNCNDFFNSFFYMSNDFLADFFRKNIVALCEVCKKGVKPVKYCWKFNLRLNPPIILYRSTPNTLIAYLSYSQKFKCPLTADKFCLCSHNNIEFKHSCRT